MKYALNLFLGVILAVSVSCGTDTDETSSQKLREGGSLIDGIGTSPISRPGVDYRLIREANQPLSPSRFATLALRKVRTMNTGADANNARLRRDINCTDDGKICLDCYYNGSKLIYCDVYEELKFTIRP
ncbi:MAG: hypothetical protein HRU19_29615 [Pseudobacteriovorax sp.]|nr:hypothetical protein [Pseudobacteriovorax sp.]